MTRRCRTPDPDAITAALLEGIRLRGLACLPWNDAARALQARMQFVHQQLDPAWPDVSDAALLVALENWLAAISFKHVAPVASCTAGFVCNIAGAIVVATTTATRTTGADPYHRAQRFAHPGGLFTLSTGAGGAPAGNVWPGRYAANCTGKDCSAVAFAVTGATPGADHPGPRRVLAELVS